MAMTTTNNSAKSQSRRDAFLQRVTAVSQQDQENKNKFVSDAEVTLPLIVTGRNPTGTLIRAVVPPLHKMRELVRGAVVDDKGAFMIEVDTRSKEDLVADEKHNVDLSTYQLHDAAVAGNQPDPKKEIKRVGFHFRPMDCIKLINKTAVDETLGAGMFIVARIEPRAWHDEKSRPDTKPLQVMIRLGGVLSMFPLPLGKFIPLMNELGAGATPIRTKVVEYRRAMAAAFEAKLSEEEKKNVQYSIVNDFIVMTGFNYGDYLDRALARDSGVCFRERYFDKETDYKFHKKERKTDLNKLKMEYTGESWSLRGDQLEAGEHGYPFENPQQITKFGLEFSLWNEFVDQLGITSITAWHRLAPVNAPYIQALVVLGEDFEKTMINGVTRTRIEDLEDANGQGDINAPHPDGESLSFYMIAKVNASLVDPVTWVETVGIPVSSNCLRAVLWGNSTVPKGVMTDAQFGPLDLNKKLINASELKVDVRRLLDNPNYEARVLVNVRSATPGFRQDHFGKLSVQEGDDLLTYFARCLARNQELTMEQYIKNNKLNLPETHVMRRATFTISGGEFIPYVYFINRAAVKESFTSFVEFLASVKGASSLSSLLTDGTGGGSDVQALPASSKVTVEEVKQGKKRTADEAALDEPNDKSDNEDNDVPMADDDDDDDEEEAPRKKVAPPPAKKARAVSEYDDDE